MTYYRDTLHALKWNTGKRNAINLSHVPQIYHKSHFDDGEAFWEKQNRILFFAALRRDILRNYR